ncbi:MAG TPA: hypothetical protein VHC49_00270 [Mycobacteriales bacterium]|nr:hypothetical protein [Mycobacteriales bacterium]
MPNRDPQEIASILENAGVSPRQGDGTVFGEPVIVIAQAPADGPSGYLYELVSAGGTVIGSCTEQRVAVDPSGSFGQIMEQNSTDQMKFFDPDGALWAGVSHRKVWKSRITVTGADGAEIGRIQQRNVLGKIRLDVLVSGQKAGRIRSTNTRMHAFDITGDSGQLLGRIVKIGNYASWRVGRDAKAAGLYVLDLAAPLPQPLATIIAVAPIGIDLAFSPDQAGYRATAG